MKLVTDWRAVLRHAWSLRLNLLCVLLSALSAALMFGDVLPIPAGWLFLLTLVVNLAAGFARLVQQKHLPEAGK